MIKSLKILCIIIMLMLYIICTNVTFASSATELKGDADSWINKGMTDTPISTSVAWSKLMPIGQILVACGGVVLVSMFMWLGIKYMVTDPSGKANIKEKLIGLIVASVIIYGGMGLFAIIVSLMNNIL